MLGPSPHVKYLKNIVHMEKDSSVPIQFPRLEIKSVRIVGYSDVHLTTATNFHHNLEE